VYIVLKNKKYMIPLFFLLFLSSIMSVRASEDKSIIVCTTEVLGSLVREYVGEEAIVVVLVNPSLCPADFDMKPSDLYAVREAVILFKQGIPGEFWLQGLLEASVNVNLTQVAVPGVYNTPEGAKRYIEGVGGNLTEALGVDLSGKKAEMLGEVDTVQDWMASRAQEYGVSSVKVICMMWQKAFVESAGFQVVATYNPPETLSAGEISGLVETGESEGVALIVDNMQVDVEFGKGIATQVGAEHVVLTNFPGAVPGTGSLAEMFRYNADQLYKGVDRGRYTAFLRAEKEYLENRVSVYQVTTALVCIVAGVEAVLLIRRRRF
jgi:zinc/manganese transport system substrate-binding protein/zinc transport system substrate-binding protein